jgi:hypothetical protein
VSVLAKTLEFHLNHEFSYQNQPPAVCLETLVDAHPGLGHLSRGTASYMPMTTAIVIAEPGCSNVTVCSVSSAELSRVRKSSYSPARIFSLPGPALNRSVMTACIVCPKGDFMLAYCT